MQLGSSKDSFPCFTRLNPCVAHCSTDSIPWVLTLKGRRVPWLRRGICPLANPCELWYDNQPSIVSFLPSAARVVSMCIDARVDIISWGWNRFYVFCSLSSLIPLSHQQKDELSTKLMHVETTINSPLGLPLGTPNGTFMVVSMSINYLAN
jgi:hypothetical protein